MYFSHVWILDQDVHSHSDDKVSPLFRTCLSYCCVLNDEEQEAFSHIHFYEGLTLFVKISLSQSSFVIHHILMPLHYELSV